MQIPATYGCSFASDDTSLIVIAKANSRSTPAGYTILRQIDGKPLKQSNNQQLFGKLP